MAIRNQVSVVVQPALLFTKLGVPGEHEIIFIFQKNGDCFCYSQRGSLLCGGLDVVSTRSGA